MWLEQIPKLKGPLFLARISTVAEMLKQRCRQHFYRFSTTLGAGAVCCLR
jgi:hypothetical protein